MCAWRRCRASPLGGAGVPAGAVGRARCAVPLVAVLCPPRPRRPARVARRHSSKGGECVAACAPLLNVRRALSAPRVSPRRAIILSGGRCAARSRGGAVGRLGAVPRWGCGGRSLSVRAVGAAARGRVLRGCCPLSRGNNPAPPPSPRPRPRWCAIEGNGRRGNPAAADCHQIECSAHSVPSFSLK